MRDLQEVLAELRLDLQRERALRTAAADPIESTPSNMCRYCRRPRQSYAGSKIDGHAICMVGDAYRARLVAAMRDPRLTYCLLSLELGLSIPTLRAWYSADRSP